MPYSECQADEGWGKVAGDQELTDELHSSADMQTGKGESEDVPLNDCSEIWEVPHHLIRHVKFVLKSWSERSISTLSVLFSSALF